MTFQRFLYKLFWRRLGVPLIIGCGIIAMVTTFYHHSLYKFVDEPPNSQKAQQKRDSEEASKSKQYVAAPGNHKIIKYPGKVGNYLNPHGDLVEFGPVVDTIVDNKKEKRYRFEEEKNERHYKKIDTFPEQKKTKNEDNETFKKDSSYKEKVLVRRFPSMNNTQYRKKEHQAEQEKYKKDKNHKAKYKKSENNLNNKYQPNQRKHNEYLPGIRSKSATHLVYNQSVLIKDHKLSKKNKWRNFNYPHNQTSLQHNNGLRKDPFIRKTYTFNPRKKYLYTGKPLLQSKQNSTAKYMMQTEKGSFKRTVKYNANGIDVSFGQGKDDAHLNSFNSNIQNRWKYPVHVNNSKVDPIIKVKKVPTKLVPNQINDQSDNKDSMNKKMESRKSENNKDIIKDPFVESNNRNEHNFQVTGKLSIAKVHYDDSILNIHKNQNLDYRTTMINNEHPQKQKSKEAKRPVEFMEWSQSKTDFCDRKFEAYYNEFVLLKGVIVDRDYFTGKAGGEDLKAVLNQPEEDEYFKYEMGCFQLPCDSRPDYFFNGGYFPSDYLFNMKTHNINENVDEVENRFTIALTRYEYVNIYHTMTDWYNAFLLMNFFNKTKEETNILIIDSHPKGGLDSGWATLFNSWSRLSQLKKRTRFSQMAWNMLGYESPILNHFIDSIPLVDEFRDHFLSSFNVEKKRKLDCMHVRILFIWRKDYLAHPRNPTGKLSRKIKNEKELLKSLKRKHSEFNINGIQLDLFNLEQQLRMIANTDILIGMHGAGLTHTFFLPEHAGLIELIPNYWTSAMDHFMSIATWRGILYERWVNSDPHNEVPDDSTRVPPEIINVLVKSLLRKMKCLSNLKQEFDE